MNSSDPTSPPIEPGPRQPTYDFRGRVAIVTGATGGMGAAIVQAFARSGAMVMATDLSDRAGQALVEQLEVADGATVEFRAADVSDPAQVEAVVSATVERFGGLDMAVNAAAIEFETVSITDCSDDDFDRMMRVNSGGVFSCMKHQLRAILAGDDTRRSRAAIVNVASTNSFRPQRDQPAYTASKHAVLGITRAAALDASADGVRINAICPGAIDTPMLRNAMERRGRDAAATAKRLSPLGRFGRPEEIAAAALWLCSDAASFVTGHALAVDGGMLAS